VVKPRRNLIDILYTGAGVAQVIELLNSHRLIAYCKRVGGSAKALALLKQAGIEGTNGFEDVKMFKPNISILNPDEL
jgi:rhodanese-related sulfurtransferase